MLPLSYQGGVPQYTWEHYQRDFADRHLLHGVIAKWARESPDRVAIREYDTGRSITYQQFHRAATAWAHLLVEQGYRRGDFLATSLPLLADHVLLEYACFQIGVIHAPLDLRLKATEVIRSLELIRARGFVCLGKTPLADFGPLAEAVRQACPFVQQLWQFCPPDQVVRGAQCAAQHAARAWAAATGPGDAAFDQATRDTYRQLTAAVVPTDGAQVIYTTGSTGYPKPALLSHQNITVQNMCLAGAFEMLDQPRMLVNLPPSHVGCQAEQLMTTFFGGGTAVLLHVFDAEKSLRAIADERVTCFGQIPAMFALQWRLPNYRQFDLSSLRFALFGGQAVTRQFLAQLAEMAPRFGTGLGLTEMAGFVTYTPLEGSTEDFLAGVGWPMPVTPLSIRQPQQADGSAGAEVPPGEVGEICFHGPQVFLGYVNDAEATRRAVTTDGYCYTGDLGSLGPKGLTFAGRAKQVIKPKGYQVFPAQVEDHFTQHAAVAACAAVGQAHEVFSEAIVLFVEARTGAELVLEELHQHARDIAAYMRPTHYVLLPPGGLPLNRVAKTDYVQLKERAADEVAQLRARGQWDRE